jgi:2-polyprenyl-3-methyl-5-hydroxy-6-metoxy-1,4-benzoquinol methylase
MTDLFADKAAGWDQRPIPQQISEGVVSALRSKVDLQSNLQVLDFGAGTGLIASKIAADVGEIIAVDVSASMLEQLAKKEELAGRVRTVCQDLLDTPLESPVDLVVSAMALHHVEDTARLMQTFFAHLKPGGRVALADLDTEDGSFHPPGTEGVFHTGFDRDALRGIMEDVGFERVEFATACEVGREDRSYPVFLVVAQRPER